MLVAGMSVAEGQALADDAVLVPFEPETHDVCTREGLQGFLAEAVEGALGGRKDASVGGHLLDHDPGVWQRPPAVTATVEVVEEATELAAADPLHGERSALATRARIRSFPAVSVKTAL